MSQNLYEFIQTEMRDAFKEGYPKTSNLLKVLLSDIQRDPRKDYSDEKVINVITKTIKLLKESHQDSSADDIRCLQAFLPKEISEDEIVDFLSTIDWESLRSPKQAVGITMKHFPKGSLTGSVVSKLVDEYNR